MRCSPSCGPATSPLVFSPTPERFAASAPLMPKPAKPDRKERRFCSTTFMTILLKTKPAPRVLRSEDPDLDRLDSQSYRALAGSADPGDGSRRCRGRLLLRAPYEQPKDDGEFQCGQLPGPA